MKQMKVFQKNILTEENPLGLSDICKPIKTKKDSSTTTEILGNLTFPHILST